MLALAAAFYEISDPELLILQLMAIRDAIDERRAAEARAEKAAAQARRRR